MNLQEVAFSSFSSQLSHSLNERCALDITNRTAKLNDAYIRRLLRIIDWYPRNSLDPLLDCVCEVRYYLNGLA